MKTSFIKRVIQSSVLPLFITATMYGQTTTSNQQTGPKETIGVASIETKGLVIDVVQMADIFRTCIEKTNKYWIADKFDMRDIADKRGINITNCLGRNCNVELGKAMKIEKMVTGSVEKVSEKIIVTARLIDVASGGIEKTQVDEYLNIVPEVQNMVQLSINKLLEVPVDQQLSDRLTKITSYESATANPGERKIRLDGPRMGLTTFTGEALERITDSKSVGGYDAFPVMTQFGYQFETQYLSNGDFQALFEYIPLVTGIDQGYFIPSFTLLNGFRNSRNGWEFAFGPSVSITRMAKGFYDANGNWVLKKEWEENQDFGGSEPVAFTERLDRRGNPALSSGFVFAFGKSFKSGQMNIPVNIFVMPGKHSWRFGASFGFNTKNKTTPVK